MSTDQSTGRATGLRRPAGPASGQLGRSLAGCLAGLGVLAQITYPLTSGDAALAVTVASVLLLSPAALVHAWSLTRSVRVPLAVLVAAAGTGWVAETIGVHTGFPFGAYRYTGLLGPAVLGVPILVPLAWTMLAYPCLLAGRHWSRGWSRGWTGGPTRGRAGTAVIGGLTLASWDLFLDPQLVELGGWTWRFPHPALPGVPGIPLTNYAGWAVVSVVMIALLDRLLDRVDAAEPGLRDLTPRQQAVPAAVLAWTWLGSALGNLVFFGRPAVAAFGFVAMGVLAGPYLWSLITTPITTPKPR